MGGCHDTITLAEALADPIVRDLMMADGIDLADLKTALTQARHPAANAEVFAPELSVDRAHLAAARVQDTEPRRTRRGDAFSDRCGDR